MQATVAIKTKLTPEAPAAQAKSPVETTDSASFSNELDKHLSTGTAKEKVAAAAPTQTEKAAKQGERTSDTGKDGKNLPSENVENEVDEASTQKTTDNKQADTETVEADDKNADAEHEEAPEFITASSDSTAANTRSAEPKVNTQEQHNTDKQAKPTPVTSGNTTVVNSNEASSQTPQQQSTTAEVGETDAGDASKRVVSVAPAAEQHAKTTAVELKSDAGKSETTAKAGTTAVVNSADKTVDATAANKPAAMSQQQVETDAGKVRTATQAGADKAVNVTQQDVEIVTQNRATKAESAATSVVENKPVEIRADILNAIKKQSSSATEVQQTLKNMVASQLQEKGSQEGNVSKASLLAAIENRGERLPTTSVSSPLVLTPVTQTTATSGATTALAANPTTLDIQPPVQSAVWSKVMSGRVVWMAKEGIQQAEIRLTPAKMGPVEVKLHVHNDQVNVTFLAQHAATRDALEQAIPRLRDSFNESGIQLANAEVGADTPQSGGQSDAQDSGSEYIFSQAGESADDINIENELKQGDNEPLTGLSLYA